MYPHPHPHPEKHQRAEDQTISARVAHSPYANIAHLAATVTLLLTVLGFGARFYTEVQTTTENTKRQDAVLQDLRTDTNRLQVKMSSVKTTVKANGKDIDRVEKQAAQDRKEILKRLDVLNLNVNELNRYLRNNAMKSEKSSYRKEASGGS